MAVIFEDKNRLIIPRWREFKRSAVSLDHLPQLTDEAIGENFADNLDFIMKLEEWNQTKSIPSALELVNSAYSLGLNKSAVDAAKLLQLESNLPTSLVKIVRSILGQEDEIESKTLVQSSAIDTFFKFIGKHLSSVRKRLIDYPLNPLLWVEAARLHSILGNNVKAERCLIVAHKLSNGLNRSITRAYSRFFYHIGDTDRAHEIVRKSPLITNDPWIMASEISYALKRERFSNNVKKGLELIESKNYSPGSISELASMIATSEMFNGGFKNARRLAGTSLQSPNDNTLAQAEWLSRHLSNIHYYEWLDRIEFTYEAKAHEFLYKGNYDKALEEGFNWMIDQPFSQRAVQFTSYISSALIKNAKNTVEVCSFGLRSNSESFEITSNLTYARAILNETNEARKQLANLKLFARQEEHYVYINANEGLINFREKNYPEGEAFYKKAIGLAEKIKRPNLKRIALINFIREKCFANMLSKEEAIKQVLEVQKEHGSSTVGEVDAIKREIMTHFKQA